MAPEQRGFSADKDNYAKRLRRVEGQVRGIAKMIDDEKYCIDILTQISAVNSALQSVALGLLSEHLNHCVSHAVAEGGEEADKKLAEASAAIARLVRSGSRHRSVRLGMVSNRCSGVSDAPDPVGLSIP